jgi:rhodanese-related sulfurtransferase
VDAAGSLLYGSCYLGVGYLFSRQIEQIGAAIARIGGSTLSLLVGLVALYIAYKYWQRQRLLHELRMARISADELRQKLETGEKPVILDLRSSAELAQDPSVILGAIHLGLDEIEKRQREFPHDRDIVVYCSCPNEVTSARIALSLQRKGFTRVRPLLGGIDAWRRNKYPTEIRAATVTTTASNVVVDRGANPQNPTPSKAVVGKQIPANARSQESEHDTREHQA